MKSLSTVLFLIMAAASRAAVSQGIPQDSAKVLMTADSLVGVAVVSDSELYILVYPNFGMLPQSRQKVARADLAREVDELLRRLPNDKQIIYVKAMPDVSYGTIVKILDDIKASGHDRFGLIADKPQGQPMPNVSLARDGTSDSGDSNQSSGARTSNEKLLVVTIDKTRAGGISIRIDKTVVPLRVLANKVRSLLEGRAQRVVWIMAPANIQYKSILAVVDQLVAGGAGPVRLSVRSP